MPSVKYMSKIDNIPEKNIQDDSSFYKPADALIQAVKEYYERIHGVTLSDKQVEEQVILIIRSKI